MPEPTINTQNFKRDEPLTGSEAYDQQVPGMYKSFSPYAYMDGKASGPDDYNPYSPGSWDNVSWAAGRESRDFTSLTKEWNGGNGGRK